MLINENEIEKCKFILDNVQVGAYMLADEDILYINPRAAEMLGYTKEEISKDPGTIDRYVSEEYIELLRERIELRLQGKSEPGVYEIQLVRKDQTKIRVAVAPAFSEFDGKPVIIGTMIDVNLRDVLEKTAVQALREYRSLFQYNMDSVFSLDSNGFFTDINPAGLVQTGYSKEELIQQSFTNYIAVEDLPHTLEAFNNVLKGGSVRIQSHILNKNGSRLLCEIVAIPKKSDDRIIGVYGISKDISESVQQKAEMEKMAYYDMLTGLANRRLVFDKLEEAIESAGNSAQKAGLLFIDLDKFKQVNDEWGHEAGDELLQQVASRLQTCTNDNAVLGRIAGDEFVIILPNAVSLEEIMNTANKTLKVIRTPYRINEKEVEITPSIGISIYPDHGNSPEFLLRNADRAMYESKKREGNGITLYNSTIDETYKEKVKIETSIRQSLDTDQFFLVYQPRVDAHSLRTISYEVLIRWNHPKLGMVSPSTFIPIAEASGLIIPLGYWILREACRTLKSWDSLTQLSINVSSKQLNVENFANEFLQIVTSEGIEPNSIEIEMTERLFIEHNQIVINNLKLLSQAGVRISIDDFGTGYSSLVYLQRFSVDIIKIDRSFVENVSENKDNEAIIRAIVQLAQSLDILVVAEGVETESEFRKLQELGADEIQGYYISRPLPESEVRKALFS
ncbi:EAL domain-containing protein [Fredinandcohnia sp. 179-A 10B2 NHS]|uniref:sensor domain-containing protein n=1 Tax=Fredinandcohnia sp. 179-A 10B2 NHS TaxID=3235176 RepID=UPI0039A2BC7C